MLHRKPKIGEWVHDNESIRALRIDTPELSDTVYKYKKNYSFCTPPVIIEPPKPREVFINLYPNGEYGDFSHKTRDSARSVCADCQDIKTLLFREVVEE